MIITRNLILFLLSCFYSCSPTVSVQSLGFEKIIPSKWSNNIPNSTKFTGDWWLMFGDSLLNSTMITFQKKSTSLQTIIARTKKAHYAKLIAKNNYLPSINANLNGSGSKQNLAAFGLPEGFLGEDESLSSETQVTSFSSSNYGLNLALQWEVDLWGKLFDDRVISIRQFKISDYELSYLEFSYYIQFVKAYYSVVEAKSQLQLAEETVLSSSNLSNMVSSRYEKGLKSSLDFRLSESSLASSQAQHEVRKQIYLMSVRNLQLFIGLYPDGVLAHSDSLPFSLPGVPMLLPANFIERRPDIRISLLNSEIASSRVSKAIKNFLPSLVLTNSSGTSSNDLKDILNDDYQVSNKSLNFNFPIFQGFKLINNLKLEKINMKLSEIVVIQTITRAFSEVEQLLFMEESNSKQLEAYSIASNQSIAAYELSKERYDSGLIGLTAVLDSQQRMFLSRSQVLSSSRSKIETRLNLILALGGELEEDSK